MSDLPQAADPTATIAAWLAANGHINAAFQGGPSSALFQQVAVAFPMATFEQVKHALRLVYQVEREDITDEEYQKAPNVLRRIMPEGWRP